MREERASELILSTRLMQFPLYIIRAQNNRRKSQDEKILLGRKILTKVLPITVALFLHRNIQRSDR